ncbi:hypothetical protein [Rhodoferax sp. BLA1]|uniref:hypothetical protein n=1 Tax=Rhodoferax sp. BLA1 TaxID=2576062 RepID=UPI0015D30872|nr:hypothetical protein [Rhodoferax sp. BLA1]
MTTATVFGRKILPPILRPYMSKTYHLIYLLDEVEDPQWSHLHRFIHPGSRNEQGWKSIFCRDLDMSGQFLSCLAKDYSGGKAKNIFLRHGLIASIIEIASHDNPLGFKNLEADLE